MQGVESRRERARETREPERSTRKPGEAGPRTLFTSRGSRSSLTRYVIKRTDERVEDLVVESEGLTIGRLPGNDLVLNHRAVSETHAGVREIDGQYWLFNLTQAGGVALDGALIDRAPLPGGGIAQIGPYLLRFVQAPDGVAIIVELEAAPAPGRETGRLLATGALPALWPGLDEQALKIFWDKRRREAGKIKQRSPLHPQREPRLGKTQFNWAPTLDLKQPWRASYFVWGSLAVLALALAALIGYPQAFSFDEVAAVHGLRDAVLELPWYGWLGVTLVLPAAGLVWAGVEAARRRSFLKRLRAEARESRPARAATAGLKAEGPAYPHPVIDPQLCIGCHACVEACPHSVLEMVGGVATPVALDQCMEDTSCMVECPTSPKACVVVNTSKIIPPRKVPRRDQKFMTGVPGLYLIGDVSGVPLIKNAINEGAQVIEHLIEDLRRDGRDGGVAYDVAIIGAGPAGLSAAATARQRGLRYVAFERNRIVSTIQNYPAGKYVIFKPDAAAAKGPLPLPGAGAPKEELLASWARTVMALGLEIHEGESCQEIKRGEGCFTVVTARGSDQAVATYRASRVVLAVGNHGSPAKLGVPGEDLKGKVRYELVDPDDYRGHRCLVVGSGNSAVEAAVALSAPAGDNEVALVVRGDFKGDLKLANKMNVHDRMDAGRIKVFFGATVKEIRQREVVLADARTGEERGVIANDYVFALIGSEKPTKFLEGLGIAHG